MARVKKKERNFEDLAPTFKTKLKISNNNLSIEELQ